MNGVLHSLCEFFFDVLDHNLECFGKRQDQGISFDLKAPLLFGKSHLHRDERFDLFFFLLNFLERCYSILNLSSRKRVIEINENTSSTYLTDNRNLVIDVELHTDLRINLL